MLVSPFAALRPRPDTASAVIAPPYDVVDTDEARALAAGQPESFLHISRPEIDLAPDTDPYSDEVYARGADNLSRLIGAGVLERERTPCYYVYRMRMGEHSQTGIALGASVVAYEANRIHRHELTRPDKENDRVRNIEALNAQTGPVLLAYKANAAVDGLLVAHSVKSPLLEAEGQHGVVHSVWRIDDDRAIAALTDALTALGDLYIADGHHRSAAAARVAAARRGRGKAPDASHEFFLSVAFPDDQMQVFDYNRVVTDLNGLSPDDFVAAVAREFSLEPVSSPAKPEAPHHFGMYLDRQWYRLVAGADSAASADYAGSGGSTVSAPSDASTTSTASTTSGGDPVARLDVSLLQNQLLAPILGVGDPRTDARIGFVGGVRGLDELERRVDSGTAAVAFALFPTGMRDLMAVADAGLLMPPKSTWFEPKLADGLLSHLLD